VTCYGFQREGNVQDIAGISIYNNDPGGIGLGNPKHEVSSTFGTVPGPSIDAPLLTGPGAAGFSARRRKA
jgi:hypothetical protein